MRLLLLWPQNTVIITAVSAVFTTGAGQGSRPAAATVTYETRKPYRDLWEL
jgi:hypothetical protein